MKRLAVALILTVALCAGCIREKPVRVGSKLFAENQVLAQMMASLADDREIAVEPSIPYGNTFALQQAMRKGDLDLYPEYTGTGAIILGAAVPPESEETLDAVRQLFTPLGMSWLEPFGFDNSFVVVLTAEGAERLNAATISDLAETEDRLKIAADPEFLERAVDGMASMVRRYGISPEPETIPTEESNALYRLLLSDKADVVVGNRTDPQIEEFNLKILTDDLDFFPVYQAAPLVRRETLQRLPKLAPVLKELGGRLNADIMRKLNAKVDREGLDPEQVALDWLLQQGLLSRRPSRPYQRPLVVAAPPMDDTPPSTARALQAVRKVFPDRPVHLNTLALPSESLRQGWAFTAVLGAEHFFDLGEDGTIKPVQGIEAVAPLSFRVVHLLVPKGRTSPGKPFGGMRRLGVGVKEGSSQQVAEFVTEAYGADVELINGDPETQAEETVAGKLNGLLVMAPQGDSGVLGILRRLQLELRPVENWGRKDRQYRYPFFRLARIPAQTYPDQKQAVETVGAQAVMAGPGAREEILGAGDPAAGLRARRGALPEGLKRRLAKALETKEAIDPALPGANPALVRKAPPPPQPLNPDPEASLLIAGFLIALAAFFVILRRSERPERHSRE